MTNAKPIKTVEEVESLLSIDKFDSWLATFDDGTNLITKNPHSCPLAQYLKTSGLQSPRVGVITIKCKSDLLDIELETPPWVIEFIVMADRSGEIRLPVYILRGFLIQIRKEEKNVSN